uniref:Cysteine and histidine-rich domain-containing protein 1 n=1 Tax=Strigamia maritima TaxID=126957 RepID=T1J3V6_STRMM
MTEASKLIQCYNKGCSQLYDPEKNHAEACTFHPGDPFFHDAYKGWACCNKKCTDFTEFLNIKGCTKSFHNNVKPPEPEKPIVDKSKKDEVESNNQETSVIVGTSCKNSGCRKTYEGAESNTETCVYHSGMPVFHEGLKFWTCCLKKTTDFNSFLEQVGCTSGNHVWTKQESAYKKNDCRYDWHQTGSNVFISLYTKGVLPDKCTIEANAVKLKLYIQSAEGFVYDNEFVLFGIIDVENSLVTMSATKVEIKLKKAEPLSWQKLTLVENAS